MHCSHLACVSEVRADFDLILLVGLLADKYTCSFKLQNGLHKNWLNNECKSYWGVRVFTKLHPSPLFVSMIWHSGSTLSLPQHIYILTYVHACTCLLTTCTLEVKIWYAAFYHLYMRIYHTGNGTVQQRRKSFSLCTTFGNNIHVQCTIYTLFFDAK